MHEGWPAQEDGTDSGRGHPSRKTHDLLSIRGTAGCAARVVRGQHPGGIEDRYPSWWGHAPAALPLGGKPRPGAGRARRHAPLFCSRRPRQPPSPPPPPPLPPRPPPTTSSTRFEPPPPPPLPPPSLPHPPRLRPLAGLGVPHPLPRAAQSVQPTPWAPDPEPPAPAPAPAPKPAKKKAVATATTATQTRNALHLRKLRSEFMPCVRNDVAARRAPPKPKPTGGPRARASSMASGNKKSPASALRRRGVSGCSPSSPVATRPTRR